MIRMRMQRNDSEAKLENKRGNTVTVILKTGLRKGDPIATASAKGKVVLVPAKQVAELVPSGGEIFGFEELPAVGEEFRMETFGKRNGAS